MAIRMLDEEDSKADAGTWVPWKKDPDTGQLIQFKLRSVPAAFTKKQRARYNRGVKSEQLGKRSVVELTERQIEATQERALYALLDSEHFEIEVGGQSTAAALLQMLGRPVDRAGFETLPGPQLVPGSTLCVDGRWPQLGGYILDLMPALASWISEKADDLAGLEADDEEELGKT